jgi:4'-phosphopantetheinyl transferase EntD
MLPELTLPAMREFIGTAFTVPILIALQGPEDAQPAMTPAEREQLSRMGSAQRQHDYRCGRAALKQILAALGRDTETAHMQWPDAFCSLSHSGGMAVAAGLPAGGGIGIDLQLDKRPPDALADRLLSKETLAIWKRMPEQERATALQRFWTVNEAVYKACPGPQPAYFRHYRMIDPMAYATEVVIEGTDYRFQVASLALKNGFLSLAVRSQVAFVP